MDENNSIEMSSEAFASVNVPVSVFSIFLNLFFVFCMIFPLQGRQRQKQPLKSLLGSLVGCNISAHASILVMVVMVFNGYFDSDLLWWCVPFIPVYIMMISINSSHWMNVLYCFQVIPVKRPYFIWLKRNIRVFIFCALIINIASCLLGMAVNIASPVFNTSTDTKALDISTDVAFWMTLSLFFLSLCVMIGSSSLTVYFLWRHVKNMEKNGDSLSSPRRQRQIRVTIISICAQALLHIICSAFIIIDLIIIMISPYYFDMENNMFCTVICLYSFGTAVNLGLSQSVFRQQAVHTWQKCFRPQNSSSASTMAQAISSAVFSS